MKRGRSARGSLLSFVLQEYLEERESTTACTRSHNEPWSEEKLEPLEDPYDRAAYNASLDMEVDKRHHRQRKFREERSINPSSELNRTGDVEVPRLLTSGIQHLDLSSMLEHVGDSSLFEITARWVETIEGEFDHPIGVCSNMRGEVIVADTNNNLIKLCADGQWLSTLGQEVKMKRPSAVVVNRHGEIFVKDDHCVHMLDSRGRYLKAIGDRLMVKPFGLALTENEELIVLDASFTDPRVFVFPERGDTPMSFPFQPLRDGCLDSKCRFLAVHQQALLTSDLGRSCLYLTSLEGEVVKTVGRKGSNPGELNEPAGISTDSVGNWVVADSRNHRIQVFARNGHYMATLRLTGDTVRRPSGLHLTPDGLLYIIDYFHSNVKVFRIDRS